MSSKQTMRPLESSLADSLLPSADQAALADLAFGSLSGSARQRQGSEQLSVGRHLAFLPLDALELDLNDPQQRQLGDYELLELIGQGGMGVVYRARQISLDREVAVKLLAAGPWASREFISRFQREAQNAARMQHPNIVTVYEVGTAEDLHFFSMRLVHGRSLAGALHVDGPWGARAAAALMRTIAEAVEYAHRLNVLHLDLKPANVLLDEAGVAHVADFGLARRLDDVLAMEATEVSGTPSYMAPEQGEPGAQPLTPATDIWGLGAILYELVTGQPPFSGGSAQATLVLLREARLPEPRRLRADLPLDLDAIIQKCLARNPAERYASAGALADDLARFIDQREVKARPLSSWQRIGRWMRREPKVAAAALFAVGALVIGLLASTQQWQRAEKNAAISNQRLWESRRQAALRQQQDGNGFQALPGLIANVEEQEHAEGVGAAAIERREIGSILSQGVILIDRMIVPDAMPLASELSPDGRVMALALNDMSVRWFDTETLTERGRVDLAALPTSDGNMLAPRLLRFVDNQRLRVTLDWPDYLANPGNGDTYLIDLERAEVIEPPIAYSDAIFSADGKHALVRTQERTIQTWQVEPWKALSATVSQPANWDLPWLLGRDARFAVAVLGTQFGIELRNPLDLDKASAIAMPDGTTVHALMESNNGAVIAVGDGRGRVSLVDAGTRAVHSLRLPAGSAVKWISFSEDDAWIAIVRADGGAFAFDVATRQPLNAGLMLNDFEPRQVAISHAERLLVAAGSGATSLWRIAESGPIPQEATRLPTSPTRVMRAGTNSMGVSMSKGLLATASMDGEVRLWRLPSAVNLPARAAMQIPGNLYYDGSQVLDVAYDQLRVVSTRGQSSGDWVRLPQPIAFAELVDGGKVIIASAGAALHVLDAKSMRARYPAIELPANPLRLVANPRNANLVLAFAGNGPQGFEEHLIEYDLHSGQRLPTGIVLRGPLRQLELSPDGTRLLASGPPNGSTDVISSHGLNLLGRFSHDPERPVSWACFSADGELWFTARSVDEALAEEADLIRWEPERSVMAERRRLPGVFPIGVFDLQGKPLLVANDRIVLDPGASDEHALMHLTRSQATSVFARSHDGRLVALASGRDVQLYDAESLAPVGPPLRSNLGVGDFPAQLAFSPDDTQLLGRALHGHWLLWPIAADLRDTIEIHRDASLLSPTQQSQHVLALPEKAERDHLRRQAPFAWRGAESRPELPSDRTVEGEPIPRRDPHASSLMLDLTQAYGGAPTTQREMMDSVFTSASQMPWGLVRLAGTDYDLRGSLELRWGDGSGGDQGMFPLRSVGIKVPLMPIAAFHVLMFAPTGAPTAEPYAYANVRVHYRDGSSTLLPIRTGRDVSATDLGLGNVAWVRGDHLRLTGGLRQMLINNPRLLNPHPDRLIDSIDLEASKTQWATPVFFAVTAEPVTSPGNSGMESPNTGNEPPQPTSKEP